MMKIAEKSFLLLLLWHTSCQAQSINLNHRFTINEENGVLISKTEGGPKYSGEIFSFEFVCELYQDQATPLALLFRPDDGAVSINGEIFIADAGNNRVAIFNADGTFKSSIGNKGNGPGEFQALSILWVTQDSLAVFDIRLSRTSIFNNNGELIRILSDYKRAGTLIALYPLPDGNNVRVERKERYKNNAEYLSYSVLVSSPNSDTLAINTSEEFISGRWFTVGGGTGRGDIIYGPSASARYYPKHGILVWSSSKPILNWYNVGGNLVKQMILDFEMEPVTRMDRSNHRRWWQTRINQQETEQQRKFYREYQEMESLPEYKSLWAGMKIDDVGFHWVQTHYDYDYFDSNIERNSSLYKLVSPEGEYLGNVTLPASNGYIHNGYFLSRVLNNDSGILEYAVYRISTNIEGFEYP